MNATPPLIEEVLSILQQGLARPQSVWQLAVVALALGAVLRRPNREVAVTVLGIAVIGVVSVLLGRLKPAAPPVERSTVWVDTVKRGPMLRDVRGLVPEPRLHCHGMSAAVDSYANLIPHDRHPVAALRRHR